MIAGYIGLSAFLVACRNLQARPLSFARRNSDDFGLPTSPVAVTIAVEATDPQVVLAGTYDPPGLWRSNDGGDAWVRDDRGLNDSAVLV
jgi:hypothetical protein